MQSLQAETDQQLSKVLEELHIRSPALGKEEVRKLPAPTVSTPKAPLNIGALPFTPQEPRAATRLSTETLAEGGGSGYKPVQRAPPYDGRSA